MKRKYALAVVLALACLILPGCRGGTVEVPESPDPSGGPTAPASQAPAGYTRQEAYEAFKVWTEGQGIIGESATGFVPVSDGYAGLKAVVTYTDENSNTECNLSYLYEDGTCSSIGVVANQSDSQRDFTLQDGGELTYLGEGKVSLVARETATGSRYKYTVQCGEDGPDTDFTIESQALPAEE